MFFCECTDVINGAIWKASGKKTSAKVEWVAQMDPAGATMPEIVSNAGEERAKSRVFHRIVVISRDPQRRQILIVAAVVHKDAPHESAK